MQCVTTVEAEKSKKSEDEEEKEEEERLGLLIVYLDKQSANKLKIFQDGGQYSLLNSLKLYTCSVLTICPLRFPTEEEIIKR